MTTARDEIIAGIARTLFLCAYADGVEQGTIQGDAAKGGEDWDDVAPRTYQNRAVCQPFFFGPWVDGDGDLDVAVRALEAEGFTVERMNPRGRGGADVKHPDGRSGFLHVESREVPDPDAWSTATRIADAFDARAALVPRYAVELPVSARARDPFCALSFEYRTLREALAAFAIEALGIPPSAVPDAPPIGAPDALAAVAERSADGQILGWLLLRDRSAWGVSGQVETDRERPIQTAARLHEYLSGTDTFAHCLAMQALGHGVGLEDDIPRIHARLPGWILASVPRIEFSYLDLDAGRYPAPKEEGAQ